MERGAIRNGLRRGRVRTLRIQNFKKWHHLDHLRYSGENLRFMISPIIFDVCGGFYVGRAEENLILV